MKLLKGLSLETLCDIFCTVASKSNTITTQVCDKDINAIINSLVKESEISGVTELAFLMKNVELQEIVEYIQENDCEYVNLNSKVALTNKLVSSFQGYRLRQWFDECDQSVLNIYGEVLTLDINAEPEVLKKQIVEQIYNIGKDVVFYRLSVSQLQAICLELNVPIFGSVNDKKCLIKSILDCKNTKKVIKPLSLSVERGKSDTTDNQPLPKKFCSSPRHLLIKSCSFVEDNSKKLVGLGKENWNMLEKSGSVPLQEDTPVVQVTITRSLGLSGEDSRSAVSTSDFFDLLARSPRRSSREQEKQK